MARKLLLGALCVLCVSAAFAEKLRTPPSFASQLPGKHAAKVAVAGEGEYYGYGEKICLRESSRDACNILRAGLQTPSNPIASLYFQSSLSCCSEHEEGYGYGERKGMFIENKALYNPTVGTCDVTNTLLFQRQVEVVPGVTFKVGTATISCSFFDDAEKCSEELCDGFQITVEATLFQTKAYSHKAGDDAPSISSTTGAFPAPPSNICSYAFNGTAKASTLRTGDTKAEAEVQQAPKVSVASANYESEYRNPYYDEYYSKRHTSVSVEPLFEGIANVYSGLITAVSSPKHHEKYIGGKFEWVADWLSSPATSLTDYRASWINGRGISIELTKADKY